MLNFRHKHSRWLTVARGFEECLENVLCILGGKGFKMRVKSEQQKAIRQLYEWKDLLAVHFVHFELLIKGRNEKCKM